MISQLSLFAATQGATGTKYKTDLFFQGDSQAAGMMDRWLAARQPFGPRFDHHIHFKPRSRWSHFGTKEQREAAGQARKELYKSDAYSRLQIDMNA